jgi:hypothetical protein
MRDELARLVQERVGLDEATALQVADVAVEFLKSKLPAELAPLLEGQTTSLPDVGGLLGGIFGRRSE